jgi:glycine cleavage system H protein
MIRLDITDNFSRKDVIMFLDDLQVVVKDCRSAIRVGPFYTEDGLWISWDEAARTARLGLSDYKRRTTGDVTYIELPERGMDLATGDELANVETENADISVAVPLAGTVLALNDALAENPALINQDPYGAGWLVDLRPEAWPISGLFDAPAYVAYLESSTACE